MGCRILDGGSDGACLYDSVSMVVFGPVFNSYEHAEDFLDWLNDYQPTTDADPRSYEATKVMAKYGEWLVARTDGYGNLKAPECTCGFLGGYESSSGEHCESDHKFLLKK